VDSFFVLKELSRQSAQHMLRLAQDNYEKVVSYINLGESKYREGDYIAAIEFGNNAEKYGRGSDS